MSLLNPPKDLKAAAGIMNGLLISLVVWALIGLGMSGICHGQTWKPTNSVIAGWDAVAPPATGGTISYKGYSKKEDGTGQKEHGSFTTNQGTWTFTEEGRFFLGVSTIRTVQGVSVESSTISWSDNPAVTFQAQTFGIQYILPAQAPVGIKPLN
jgi:hypothetical protein